MSRILAFGDSWTKGHGVEEDIQYKENPTPPPFIAHDKLLLLRYKSREYEPSVSSLIIIISKPLETA